MRKKESILLMLSSLSLTGTERDRGIVLRSPVEVGCGVLHTLSLCEDSLLEFPIGVAGSEDALLDLGVNSFVNDSDLAMEGFSLSPVIEASGSGLVAFSVSAAEFRCMKLILGSKFFMDDLPLEEEGPGDAILFLASFELGVKRKFTLLGVAPGVGGILMMTLS